MKKDYQFIGWVLVSLLAFTGFACSKKGGGGSDSSDGTTTSAGNNNPVPGPNGGTSGAPPNPGGGGSGGSGGGLTPTTWDPMSIQFGPRTKLLRTDGTLIHPNQFATDPMVIYDQSAKLYKMWITCYTGKAPKGYPLRTLGIAYGTSQDGFKWTMWKDPVNPDPDLDIVIKPSIDGVDKGLETINIINDPITGKFTAWIAEQWYRMPHIFYGGLRRYESDDGITWVKDTNTPIFTYDKANVWEKLFVKSPEGNSVDLYKTLQGGIVEPSVLFNSKTGEYFLWYSVNGIDINPHTGERALLWRTGFAKSKDGKTWVRNGPPVFIGGSSGAWDQTVSGSSVIIDPITGGYHLFYHGGSPGIGWIGHAYSTDGLNWTKNPNNPLFKSQPNGTEDHFDVAPCVLIIPDQNSFGGYRFEMFYFTFSQWGLPGPTKFNFYRRDGAMTK
ncbi:MAG: hypothetical protein HY606_02155 [Planctomycetes bacterium]|nr:hypothetical protein [Planctomycetota bacterium]